MACYNRGKHTPFQLEHPMSHHDTMDVLTAHFMDTSARSAA
jgi:hypothetical protein